MDNVVFTHAGCGRSSPSLAMNLPNLLLLKSNWRSALI